MISTSLQEMDARLADSRRDWILYGVSILVGTCMTLTFFVRWLISPLKQMTEIAAQIAKGISAGRSRSAPTMKSEF